MPRKPRPRLFLNDGSGVFAETTAHPITSVAINNYHTCFGDYDNDGHIDLFLAGGQQDGWHSSAVAYLLWHNEGGGAWQSMSVSDFYLNNSPNGRKARTCTWGDVSRVPLSSPLRSLLIPSCQRSAREGLRSYSYPPPVLHRAGGR